MSESRRRPPVSRAARLLDLLVLALLLAGGLCWLRGYLGLRSLRAGLPPTPGALPFAALRLADHYYLLSRVGVGMVVAGVVLAVAVAVMARRGVREVPSN
ncbi:MAG TPA: hypothetical protein VKA84_02625 [Gemmatimonadaceae bacterium]|nr:hypothetical protein [Gemmatimonadaceae bacterium]